VSGTTEVPEDVIVTTMEERGGSFVKALAAAYRLADPINRALIRATWPAYWTKYAEMASAIAGARERGNA
jgi:hypothetical protein